MASNIPIIRQVSWISIIPQLLVMGLIIYLYYLLEFKEPVLYGTLTYLVLSLGLRNIIPKNHRKGIKLIKQQKFTEAIPLFEKSVDFFNKNNWLDRYRSLLILSSSKMTYKEMALCNIAFCYSQTGNGKKAKEYYELVMKEFPENGIAITGLNLIKSVEQKTDG